MSESVATGSVGPAARSAAGIRLRQSLVAWSFAVPFLVLFLIFMAAPVAVSLVMSFTDLKSTDITAPFSVDFVGLNNFTRLFGDPTFWKAVLNTAYFVVIGIPLTIALGLLAAVGVNQGVVRFRALFRVGFYLPVVTSIVAIAVVWRLLLSGDVGLVNRLLALVGIQGPDWLHNTTTAMPSLIVMAAWRNMGFLMVIFLAGLQGIPVMLYEAAEIDGAGRWQRFTQVTLPLLRPTLLFAAVITSIGYLQFFEEPFVMTQGGPLNSTLSISFYIYNQFGFGNYSYAASMSYALFLAIVGLTLVQFRFLQSNT
ncbi:MAG: sugar ABC transporter permease [Chloroflexota bacterium]|nr:sugar ABC transporter permease [Chloroflexota bacterium]